MNNKAKTEWKLMLGDSRSHYINLALRLEIFLYIKGEEYAERYQVNIKDLFSYDDRSNYVKDFKDKEEAISFIEHLVY